MFIQNENGEKQRPTKRRHVQGMLDETDPLGGRLLDQSWTSHAKDFIQCLSGPSSSIKNLTESYWSSDQI